VILVEIWISFVNFGTSGCLPFLPFLTLKGDAPKRHHPAANSGAWREMVGGGRLGSKAGMG